MANSHVLIGRLKLLAAWMGHAAETALPTASDVQVALQGDLYHVDVTMHAPVLPAIAWDVLLDLDPMTSYQPGLKVSRIVARGPNQLGVHQEGVAHFGPVSSAFTSERVIRVKPKTEIRSTNVGGTIQKMDSIMTLTPEAGGTLLRYHAEIDPGWIPPLLGPAAMRDSTASSFAAMIREMERRQGAKPPNP